MVSRWKRAAGVVAVGLVAGLAAYGSRFIGPGASPVAVLWTQVARGLVSVAVLGAAAAAGFALYDPEAVRRSYAAVLGWFALAGLVGQTVGLAAMAVAPPAGVSVVSYPATATLLVLRSVVPFTLAGFSGAAVRTLEDGR